ARVAVREGLERGAWADRVRRVEHPAESVFAGVPLHYRYDQWPRLLEAMKVDKKSRGDLLRFIVLDGLARAGGPYRLRLERGQPHQPPHRRGTARLRPGPDARTAEHMGQALTELRLRRRPQPPQRGFSLDAKRELGPEYLRSPARGLSVLAALGTRAG
ncbi:hypothetical protein ACWDAZ_36340, partial [Streptomyces sp. NPDC001215]